MERPDILIKEKIMKKVLIFILLVISALSVSAFIGCNGSCGGNPSPTPAPTPNPPPTPTPAPAGETINLSAGGFEHLELLQGESFTVPVTTTLSNAAVNAELSVETDNEEIISAVVESGKVKVSAKAVGTAKLFITASYNDMEAAKAINVTVKKGITMAFACNGIEYIDGENVLKIKSAIKNTDGIYRANEIDLNLALYVNGEEVTEGISWSNNNNAVVSLSDGKITAISVGQSNVVAEYTHSNGEKYEAKLKVIVQSTELSGNKSENSSMVFEMKEIKGDPVISKGVLFTAGEIKSVKIGQDDVLKSVDYSGKKIVLDRSKVEECSYGNNLLTVETELISVVYNVALCDKMIMNKADLDSIDEIARDSANPRVWKGYYMLGADIEYSGRFNQIASLGATGAKDVGEENSGETGFIGTFDGNGYVINGVTVGDGKAFSSGFFGSLGNGAVVKNVAFTNVTVDHGGGYSGFLAAQVAAATIKDVMVAGKIARETGGYSGVTLTFGISKCEISKNKNDAYKMKNVIVILQGYPTEVNYKSEPFYQNALATYNNCFGMHWNKSSSCEGLSYGGFHNRLTVSKLSESFELTEFNEKCWSSQKHGDNYYFLFNETSDLVSFKIYGGSEAVTTVIQNARTIEIDSLKDSQTGGEQDSGDNLVARPESWD